MTSTYCASQPDRLTCQVFPRNIIWRLYPDVSLFCWSGDRHTADYTILDLPDNLKICLNILHTHTHSLPVKLERPISWCWSPSLTPQTSHENLWLQNKRMGLWWVGKKRVSGRGEGGREGGREEESVDLLLENILTGEPSLLIPGQPLNCQVGPATNTATTCFLRRWEWPTEVMWEDVVTSCYDSWGSMIWEELVTRLHHLPYWITWSPVRGTSDETCCDSWGFYRWFPNVNNYISYMSVHVQMHDQEEATQWNFGLERSSFFYFMALTVMTWCSTSLPVVFTVNLDPNLCLLEVTIKTVYRVYICVRTILEGLIWGDCQWRGMEWRYSVLPEWGGASCDEE